MTGDDERGPDDGSETTDTSDPDGGDHGVRDDPPWPVRESVTAYETPWYDGGYDRVEQPDGTEKNYYWASLPPAVVVVAIDRDPPAVPVDAGTGDGSGDTEHVTGTTDGPAVLFVEQYRPVIRQEQLELPAGIVERSDGAGAGTAGAGAGTAGDGASDDEWPTAAAYEDAAARELEEETGAAPGETTLLQEMWCATGVLRHRRGIVLAEDLSPGERALDTNEFLTVRRVPIEEAVARARRPRTNDATVEGVLLAAAEGHLPLE